MQLVDNTLMQVEALSKSSTVIGFLNHNLLLLIFVSLAFGFAALLVEIRLPLRYYWGLPAYFLRPFLMNLGLLRKIPAWGVCVDNRTNFPIPLTAVELLDKKTMHVAKSTFSDRLGEYGFKVDPGQYVIRAVKNNYIAPPFFDPENIQLQSTDESLAMPIEIHENEKTQLNLVLEPTKVADLSGLSYKLWFYFRAFTINLANGFLIIAMVNSWYGWVIQRSALFGVLLAVTIIFMFIKLYILEAVGSASKRLVK